MVARLLLQAREPAGDALMQNGPDVSEVEKPLGENFLAILLDEGHRLLPGRPIVNPLQHAEAERAAVAEPALEQRFGELFKARDEGIGPIFLAFGLFGPSFGRGNEAFDDRPIADLKELVVFGDRAGPDGVLAR